MEEEDCEEQGSFFALPPGIADLDDSEQALCASGEFSLEEDAEALLSSGDDMQDLNAIFTPPSKKYEALREHQGVPLLGSIWAYGSEVESEGDAKYNSAESLFSKELMPFQLRGKTSVSMGDIPHLSQAQAPEQGIDWRALSPPGSLSFSPSSPPQIEDAKGRGVIGQPRFAPQLSPERKPNAWARPQQPQPRARGTQSSNETKQFHAPHQPGFYQIPTQPVKIHPTASSSPTGYQVLSPPRVTAPVVINPVGVAHSNYPPPAYFPTREGRPRSQSTPNNNNPNNPNTGYTNYKNNNPSGFVGPQRRPYNTVNKTYEQPQHFQQHPQQPLPPATKGGVGAPPYGPYPFASGQPNRQGAYWQGYPAGGNNMNMVKGSNKYPNPRYPPSRNAAPPFPQPVQHQQPVLSQPLPQQQQQQPPVNSKVLREKLLENQEANSVPPPAAQKRKVKGTWKVKSKVPAEPATQKEENTLAVDDTSLKNETIVRAPVPASDKKEVTVEHDAAAVIRQPNFLVLETKTNEAVTSVQIAVAEKPPSHGGGGEGANPTKPSSEQKSSSECSELEQDAEPIASELDPLTLAEELLAEAAHEGEEAENDETRKGVAKATKSSAASSKRRNRKGSRKKEVVQHAKHLVDVLVPAAQDNLQETEPGVSHIPLREPIAVVVKSGGGASGGAPAAHNNLPLIGVQQRRKQQPKAASLVSATGTQKQNSVNDEKGTFAWLFSSILYWIMVSAGLSMTAAESSLLLLGRLHKDAFLALLMSYNVAASVLYIYAFPYIVSPFVPITEWAPAVMWYLFLGWFLFAKGAAATVYASTSALGLRVFLPLLFLAEGVRNPTYVMRWNGGERLMLAFVLLSLKGNHFFSKRCLLSLTVFLTINYLTGFEADMDHQAESSVATPANMPPEVSMSSLYGGLFQWTILVVGLSNHYQCCSSLSSPLRPRKKYLSVFRSLARKSATLAPRFKANGAVAKGHHPHAAK